MMCFTKIFQRIEEAINAPNSKKVNKMSDYLVEMMEYSSESRFILQKASLL